MLTWRNAVAGIELTTASAGSCTTAVPPHILMPRRPAVPSSSPPESTTPMTRGPNASAAERKTRSEAGAFHAGECLHATIGFAQKSDRIGRVAIFLVSQSQAQREEIFWLEARIYIEQMRKTF